MIARSLVKHFLGGCLVVVPLGLTFYIIYTILNAIDDLLHVGIPGVGLVLTLALITLVGFLTSNVVGRAVVGLMDRVLARLPLVKLVYSSLKDLIQAFVGDRKSFDRPVSVELMPGSDVRALGFITRDELAALNLPGHVAVYLAQSYNFAGYLAIVPRARVQPLPLAGSDLMTFLVSGGVSGLAAPVEGRAVLPD